MLQWSHTPDIAVRIEGPNNEYGEAIIQHVSFNESNERTAKHYQSFTYLSSKRVCNIPIDNGVASGHIRVNYVPQSPRIQELSVTIQGEHAPGSPYLVTVDWKAEDVTGRPSFGMSHDKDMSRIQLLRRRPNVAVCSAMDDTQKQFRIL
jgi:hypothetical protein